MGRTSKGKPATRKKKFNIEVDLPPGQKAITSEVFKVVTGRGEPDPPPAPKAENTETSRALNAQSRPYPDRIRYSENTVSGQDTVFPQNTVSSQTTVKPSEPGYFDTPNTVADAIATALPPFEWAVYFRLFRLSHGWHKVTCRVGTKKIERATHMSESQVRRALKNLQQKGLIEVAQVFNSKEEKGTEYRVMTTFPQDTISQKNTVSSQDTVSPQTPNKDDDDLLNIDPHQRETMRIYQSTTKNEWKKKSDGQAYQKIKDVPLSVIEQTIQVTFQRAGSHPNHLAYFVKEILRQAGRSERSERGPARHPEEPEFDEATRAAYEEYLTQEAEAQVAAMTPAELAAARRALLTESLHKEYYQRCQAEGTLTPEVLRKGLIAERRRFLEANHSLIKFAERRRGGKT